MRQKRSSTSRATTTPCGPWMSWTTADGSSRRSAAPTTTRSEPAPPARRLLQRARPTPHNAPKERNGWALLPTRLARRLLDPLVHLGGLCFLHSLDLDVAAPSGGSERRRRVEVRAAQENDVH